MITFSGDTLVVPFGTFDLEHYEMFLRTKRIPEAIIDFDPEAETYAVKAPARFARLLGAEAPVAERPWLPMNPALRADQRWIVEMALEAKRFAVWADCGLGKTFDFLEWARQVMHRTGGRVLILSPRNIIKQTMEEAAKFYGAEMPIDRIETRTELAKWAKGEATKGDEFPGDSSLAICNYEKLIDGPMEELRWLSGLVLDESSVLKSGGGVIKWNLIKSARGIEYKLSCTATPAPNDTMEYASQAAFLEKLRTEGEILWTFFQKDKSGAWQVKPHAREAFYAFMSTWSIYLRKPAHYGFPDPCAAVPEPEVITLEIEATAEQMQHARELVGQQRGSLLFDGEKLGVTERTKLSQVAKGFIYRKGAETQRIDSRKPEIVARLINDAAHEGLNPLVWTVYDEESLILRELLQGTSYGVAVIHGWMKPGERDEVIERYRTGEVPVLISKASLLGYGMNFQHCAAMIFSGWNDSFEQWYQAIRRAYRYGQTRRLRVHVPFIPALEGVVWANLLRKQTQWEADAAQQEEHYRRARLALQAE